MRSRGCLGKEIARGGRGIGLAFNGCRQQVLQQRRAVRDSFCKHRPVHRHHHGSRRVLSHQIFEGLETLLRGKPAAPECRPSPLDPLLLLRGFADFGPRPPGNGLCRESQGPAVAGELVQEGVGRGVVRLARVAHHADPAREENEEIQITVHGRAVQVPAPQDFRPEHLFEAFPVLVGQRGVRQHPHAVDHAAQRRQFPVHPRQHPVHRRCVRHVCQLRPDRQPAFPERIDGFFSRGVRVPTPVQHDCPRSLVCEPLGHSAADPAQAAGDEIRPVLPQPSVQQRRGRHDDFPQVPGRSHEPQRGPGFGERPPAVDDRFQFSSGHPRHHVPQNPADPRRFGFFQDVQFQDGVGHVGTRGRHLLLAQDIPPGQFHEPAAVFQAGQAGVDEAFSGQAVQHHVHPGAVRGFEDFPAERGRAAVKDLLYAQRPEIRLLRRACGGEDLRACGLRHLDGRDSDSPRAGVDQHPVAGLEPGKLVGQRGRHERARHGGQRRHRDSPWRGRHQFFVRDHLRRERAESQSDHVVAGRNG